MAGGLGVAVVPEPVTALALEGVAYRRLVRPASTVELSLAHRSDRTEPHLLRTLETVRAIVSG